MRDNHDLIPKGLRAEHLFIDHERVVVFAASVAPSANCPVCGRYSRRVRSRYVRKIADLPWHGTPIILRARVRRFFCEEGSCEREIFCERLPEVTAHARKTGRLEEALLAIAFELGGRAGARLAAEPGLVVGRDALLKRIKDAPLPEVGKVRVLGVDEISRSRRAARTARSSSISNATGSWTFSRSVPRRASWPGSRATPAHGGGGGDQGSLEHLPGGTG